MSQVKVVAHPDTNAVITPSTNNPEYGTVRVDSVEKSFANGFLNLNKRTAFIRGRVSDLESLGLRAGQALAGRIAKKESFEPFYEGQVAKQYPEGHPRAGQSVLTNGRETYLQYEYTTDSNQADTWVGADSNTVSADVANALAGQAQGEF